MEQVPIDDVLPRLNELADLAEVCRSTFVRVAADSHWRPARGSAAAKTRDDLAQQDPAVNTPEILAGFNLATEVIVTYLEIAAGHLGGLAALYRSGQVMFPPLPLARSVLEHSAHAMWVIGDGSGSPADVLARAYLEEFASCEVAKMTAARMVSPQDPPYEQPQRRWAAVRERAIAAFPGTTPEDLSESRPGRTIAGQTLPGPEACVAWMFDLLHNVASGSVTERQARGMYAFLSSATHPSLYQARELRIPVDHGDHAGTVLKVEFASLERMLAAAVLAFYNALSYAISFYGITRTAHESLTVKINEVLPGYLT